MYPATTCSFSVISHFDMNMIDVVIIAMSFIDGNGIAVCLISAM